MAVKVAGMADGAETHKAATSAPAANVHDGIRKNALRANVKLSYDVPLALDDLVDDRIKRKKVPPVIPRGAQINYGKQAHRAHPVKVAARYHRPPYGRDRPGCAAACLLH